MSKQADELLESEVMSSIFFYLPLTPFISFLIPTYPSSYSGHTPDSFKNNKINKIQ